MNRKSRELKVAVKTVYLGDQSHPEGDRYTFAYTVTMQNTGTVAAKLLGRRWVITDANGKVVEVVGEGVVGEHPYLRPGEAYEYTSAATIETPVGSMHGSYQLIADDGVPFEAPIAAFSLAIPRRLH
ncbi:Co2+/Mg2+ efflux protein ApaG [Methylococcus sp. EFPC2]|uniref:Co2+/Mg2+ efflux protein ApaG n=1 Tax=Methylococcus sp. EFPC2 TaxID=2812648 RepID=UPI0019671A06|nr:Co2+/Mg2+ efflux protein ApaG [Methylococcus sp. EFPC2]QSA99320.1 Co2+/Mg2+ efflux protein ApaG [Methylococcus sp. EFPC2]